MEQPRPVRIHLRNSPWWVLDEVPFTAARDGMVTGFFAVVFVILALVGLGGWWAWIGGAFMLSMAVIEYKTWRYLRPFQPRASQEGSS